MNSLTKYLFIFQYTEADLYKQLSYFCHVFDTVSCIDKVITKCYEEIANNSDFKQNLLTVSLIINNVFGGSCL